MPNPSSTYDWWDGLGDRNACLEAAEQAHKSLKWLFERFEKVPNKNYEAGRRFEWERKKHYESLGFDVTRSAGSHGHWDLIVIDWKRGITTCVQLKVVDSIGVGNGMLKSFKAMAPAGGQSPKGLHQRLEVKVKGSREVHSVTL